jgi:eukaryotic-like serine/threonine-protein kinase
VSGQDEAKDSEQRGRPEDEVLASASCAAGAVAISRFHALMTGREPTGEPVTTLVGALERPALAPGLLLAQHKIVRELGAGGMGTVFLAERADGQFQRQVAIKVLRGLVTEEGKRRLRAERQMLAELDHPFIARLLDGGETPDGQPYLVLEYVEGEPLFAAVARRGLGLEGRVRLLEQIAEAVGHAHQRLVVHRDLKPNNVLVTPDGTPRLLDFGVARFVSDLTETSSTRVFSPGYASPEQMSGGRITTRADVFALGVLLGELVQGVRADGAPLSQPLPPVPPDADLRGIALKACAESPEERYPSVDALLDDLRRWRAGLPVRARPDTLLYRAGRFVRRHRALVAAAAAVVLSTSGLVLGLVQQSRRANREAEASRRVSEFMTGMFRISDPSEARGSSVTAREILDRAAQEVEGGLAEDRLLQARLMDTIGRVYFALGLYGKAAPQLSKAAEIRRGLFGPDDREALASSGKLAMVKNAQGQHAEAERLQREVLAAQRRLLGPEHPETLSTLNNLGIILDAQGHLAEAEAIHRQVLEARRRVLGPDHPDTAGAMNNLANSVDDQGRYPEAEQLYREVLAARRRSAGPEHPDTLVAMNNLGVTLYEQGRYAEAEKLDREVVEKRQRVLGPEHPDTLGSMGNLASALDDQGRYAEAEKLHRAVLEVERRTLGPEHPITLMGMNNLAASLNGQERHAEAAEIQREVAQARRRVLGPVHPLTLSALGNLATSLAHQGRFAEAESLLREALEGQRRALAPGHADTLETMGSLAWVLARRGRFPEADGLLHEVLEAQQGSGKEQGNTLYLFACSAALRGDRAAALGWLGRALSGKPSAELLSSVEGSEELASLRGDPAFQALLAQARGK